MKAPNPGCPERILVTGGAGFIGSHLVDALVALNQEVVIFDHLSCGKLASIVSHVQNQRARLLQADIQDRESVQQAMKGTQVVFHLAAQSRVTQTMADSDYGVGSNVTGTLNILTSAAEADVWRVVFTSSREVYGEPRWLPVSEEMPLEAKNAYGASKIAAEAYCRMFVRLGLDVALLRLTNVYGPRDKNRVIPLFIQNALRGTALTLFGGYQVIDFVPIDTVIRVLLAAGFEAWPSGVPVNIGSGVGTPICDLIDQVLRLANSTSLVEIEPSRPWEVVRFVAATERLL